MTGLAPVMVAGLPADDVTIRDHGSIVLLVPESADARAWCDEHIGEHNGYQPYWPTVLTEPRYVGSVVSAMTDDGLLVGAA